MCPAVVIALDSCIACQQCNICPVDNISYNDEGKVIVGDNCVSCNECVNACPSGVLEMQ